MTETATRAGKRHILAAEYAPGVLDQIRTCITDGFDDPAGGSERGGILLGTRSRWKVIVAAVRPIPCSHQNGVVFDLQAAGEAEFERALSVEKSETALTGLEPVGWFVSHVQDSLVLRASDREIFDRYFREEWQVTLIVRPGRIGSLRAATLRRGEDGTEVVLNEFGIRQGPVGDRGPAPAASSPGPAADRAPLPVVTTPPRAAVPPAPRVTTPAAPPPRLVATAPTAERPQSEERPPSSARPLRSLTSRRPPRLLRPPEPAGPPARRDPAPVTRPVHSAAMRPSAIRRALLTAALVITVAGVTAAVYLFARTANDAGLQAFERNGVLQIEWNPRSRPVAHATSAELAIRDGGHTTVLHLSREELDRGLSAVLRQNADVTARLRLFDRAGNVTEEQTHYAGRPVMRDAPIRQKVVSLESENADLRQQLEQQRMRAARFARKRTRPLQ